MGCTGWKGTGGDPAGSSTVLLTVELFAGFKLRLFPQYGWGGDTGGWEVTEDKYDLAGARGSLQGGKDITYWLVTEAWVAGWGKLAVQTV